MITPCCVDFQWLPTAKTMPINQLQWNDVCCDVRYWCQMNWRHQLSQSKRRSLALFFCLFSSGSLYSFTYKASASLLSTNLEYPFSMISKFSAEMLIPWVSLYLNTEDCLSVLQCWSTRLPNLTLVCPTYFLTPSCLKPYTRLVWCSRGTGSFIWKNEPTFFPLKVNLGLIFFGKIFFS